MIPVLPSASNVLFLGSCLVTTFFFAFWLSIVKRANITACVPLGIAEGLVSLLTFRVSTSIRMLLG